MFGNSREHHSGKGQGRGFGKGRGRGRGFGKRRSRGMAHGWGSFEPHPVQPQSIQSDPLKADPTGTGGVCPLCDNHCPLSNPACGKGRRHAGQGGAI